LKGFKNIGVVPILRNIENVISIKGKSDSIKVGKCEKKYNSTVKE